LLMHAAMPQDARCIAAGIRARIEDFTISRNSICTTTSDPHPNAFLNHPETALGTRRENTRIVLISLSRNRLPDSRPASKLELRDPWWQAFLSYVSQVLASRHPSLVDGPLSAERMVQVRAQN
jgi:hypothetical protein